jgi:hypothetical protein
MLVYSLNVPFDRLRVTDSTGVTPKDDVKYKKDWLPGGQPIFFIGVAMIY